MKHNKEKNINKNLFSLKTDKGDISIFNPETGIYIEGAGGFGKSVNIIEPLIFQAIQKDYAGVIYELDGNYPTHATTAFSALKTSIHSDVESIFMINFSRPELSSPCNPISPKYIKSIDDANIAAAILLKKEDEELEITAKSSLLGDVIWTFGRSYGENLCTLPHVIGFILSNEFPQFNYLDEADIGLIDSLRIDLKKYYTKEFFYFFGKEGIDLNITNPNSPSLLCISNNPELKNYYNPMISLVLSVCYKQMNQQGKHKSIFCVEDDVYIYKFEEYLKTSRKNNVCTILSTLNYSLIENTYGSEVSEVLLNNINNFFIGRTNNNKVLSRILKDYNNDLFNFKTGQFIAHIPVGIPNTNLVQFPFLENILSRDISLDDFFDDKFRDKRKNQLLIEQKFLVMFNLIKYDIKFIIKNHLDYLDSLD